MQRTLTKVALIAGMALLLLLTIVPTADAAPKTPEEIFLKPEKQIYAFDIPIEPHVSAAAYLMHQHHYFVLQFLDWRRSVTRARTSTLY